jgi:hypothetical protein
MLASEIFNQQSSAEEKVLIIFSDMRQQTKELDFETPSLVPTLNRIGTMGARIEIANLGGVHIYALGVDGAGKSIPYWQSLRKFWIEYFRTSGARLETYTVLRDVTTGQTPTQLRVKRMRLGFSMRLPPI